MYEMPKLPEYKPIEFKTDYQRGYESVRPDLIQNTCPKCGTRYTGFHTCIEPIKTDYERGRDAAKRELGLSGYQGFSFTGK